MAKIQAGNIFQYAAKNAEIFMVMGIVTIIFMMVVPVPTFLLDILLALNISIALIILLMSIYTTDTLSMSTFPSLLLVATLFRLSLNISSTRQILLNGFAGHVIEAFGNFVVGGNAVVGFIIFLILVIIQFIVITRGAERVAEVAARFTLDAMPGKQMSIDADLNAGTITDQEAKERRRTIQGEADFYGAMDGASKFVKGDAIASIIIIGINITGGFVIGMLQMGMTAADALQRFTLLTVGEGLVNQMPALLISTATGLIVTRAASESNLGQDLIRQIFSKSKPLAIAAVVLVGLGLMPGMPTLSFWGLAAFFGGVAYIIHRNSRIPAVEPESEPDYEEQAEEMKKPENVMGLLQVEPIEFEFGYGLLPFADPSQGGPLMDRVVMIRRQCALELGIVVPTVRIRDNMQLRPNVYIIKIKGVEVAQYELMMGHYMALDTGGVTEPMQGIETLEPSFGLKAFWVAEEHREEAELANYTVVDLPTIVSTHLTEVIKNYSHELLGRQEVSKLLDNLKKEYPAVVDELVPNFLTIGEVQKVLQNLLKERVSIRDLLTIMETLADYASMTKDTDILTEYVRQGLGRQITSLYMQGQKKLNVITLDQEVEKTINDAVRRTEQGSYLSIDPATAARLAKNTSLQVDSAHAQGVTPVVLCPPVVRLYFRRLIERTVPQLTVLSYNEVDQNIEIQSIGMVKL